MEEPDFSGYATKAGLKCTDGRTIIAGAFSHQDKMTVPLVWQHGHQDASNVLGHAVLEAREDGVYAYGYFNDTPNGQHAKGLVAHKDITKLSIWANGLVEKMVAGSKQVLHGAIKEVSLVLAGANPGANIDYVSVRHSDGDVETLEEEAIITTGMDIVLEHSEDGTPLLTGDEVPVEDDDVTHASGDPTIQEIYDSLTDQQKTVVNFMIGAALEQAGASVGHTELGPDVTPQDIYDGMSDDQKKVVHSMIEAAKTDAKTEAVAEHSALSQEGNTTVTNVFEQQNKGGGELRHAAMVDERSKLTKDRLKEILDDAKKPGNTLSTSFLAHAGDYGIDDIDLLFPDARMDANGISLISRRMEWVNKVLTGTRHSPFTRVKSVQADITAEEARARGYVKGTRKKDEVIKLLRRTTGPKTIYKKQRLDRDDILDITDLDIVAFLKAEMRLMLDEEIARAVLIGDGRESDDPDKISEDNVRPVAFDDDMYTTRVDLPAGTTGLALVDAVITALDGYKGTGTPTLFTTQKRLTAMLLTRDQVGRRLFNTKADLAAAMLVDDIVPVESMESESDLVGVVVNLGDYTIGADNGGQVTMFDDFDIDFNQEKYLIETRISGALTKPKSAIALFMDSGHVVTPTDPTFVSGTGVVTIPNTTGVVYHNSATGNTLPAGAQPAIASGATIVVDATPAEGYGFAHDTQREWEFTRD